MTDRLGGRVEPARRARVRAGRSSRWSIRRSTPASAGLRRDRAGLGEPRRPRPRACPSGSTTTAARKTRRSPPSRTASAASSACSSIPRSSTPSTGARSSGTSCSTSAGVAGTGRSPSFVEEAVAEIRAARRRRQRALRALGRGRLVGDGAAPAPRARRAAHLHLRRQRRCCGRARPSRSFATSATATTCASATPTRRERFLARLAGVEDPERKRKIIGATFIEVFEERSRRRRPGRVPGAGDDLPRPDRVDVGARGPSATIKTHHNVGGLPERMNLRLVEPLRDLFKDEVRRVGRRAGPRPGVRPAASLPGSGARGAHPRRGDRRAGRDPPGGRRDLPRGAAGRGALRARSPGVRRAACRSGPSA